MLAAQILSRHQAIAKFRVAGDQVEVLEGDERTITAYLANQDQTQKNKEEFLRHKATTLENTTSLQEGTGLQILSDELPYTSPTAIA